MSMVWQSAFSSSSGFEMMTDTMLCTDIDVYIARGSRFLLCVVVLPKKRLMTLSIA
jgi:hypothetical protein